AQIQTSSHAGGIRRASMRSRSSRFRTLRSLWSRYSKPFPRRRRRIPGPEQSDLRRRGMGPESFPRIARGNPVWTRVPARILGSMPSPLDGLAAAQREAVTHPGGPLLVLGGAGTGKTRVLTRRFAWLVEEGAPADGVLALVFSPAAAV